MKSRIYSHLHAYSIFVVIAIIFGVIFVFTTPLLWGADETTQLGRAYQISQGHIQPEYFGIYHGGGYGGQMPTAFLKLIYQVNYDLTTHGSENSYGVGQISNPKAYNNLGSQKIGKAATPYVFSNTASYSPLAYLPSAIGLRLGISLRLDVSNTIYLARLCDLVFYILVVWFAIKILNFSKIKWIIFSIALLPMALFQASMITADDVTNAICLLLFALVAKGILSSTKFSTIEKVIIGLTVIGIPLLKPAYFPLIFLLLLIPNVKFSDNKKAAWIIKGTILFIGMLLFGLWSYDVRNIANTFRLVLPGTGWSAINQGQQIHSLVRHSLSYFVTIFRTLLIYDNALFSEFFGLLGFNYVSIPAISIIASFLSIVLALLISDSLKLKLAKLKITTIFIIIAASVFIVFTTFYITITAVGAGVIEGLQGRYFIPLAAPTVLGLSLLIPKLRIGRTTGSYKIYHQTTCLIIGLIVLSLTFAVIKYHYFTYG
jgi:uncharacterized membrane protein